MADGWGNEQYRMGGWKEGWARPWLGEMHHGGGEGQVPVVVSTSSLCPLHFLFERRLRLLDRLDPRLLPPASSCFSFRLGRPPRLLRDEI
jgi:hypothetical protein